MNDIKTIVLTVMLLAVFASCNQKPAKESPAQKVEVKAIRPECLLGDSITKLIQNGVVEFSSQAGTKFSLVDKSFANTVFKEVGINYYRNRNDKVRNICYGSLVSNKDIDEKYTQIRANMQAVYGEPERESKSYFNNDTAKFTGAMWDKGFCIISLSKTEPLLEENGSIIVVFTIHEDASLFKTLLP